MERNKTILHIIHNDKFTVGYAKFMESAMYEYKHIFIVRKSDVYNEIEESGINNLFLIDRYTNIFRRKQISRELVAVDRIIVSGVFDMKNTLCCLSPTILKKIYLHFWGADFYFLYKQEYEDIKDRLLWLKQKLQLLYLLKQVRAVVMLIPGEYEKLEKITGIKKRNFVAPMCDDPGEIRDYKEILKTVENKKRGKKRKRILLGNSASETNCHKEALDMLTVFRNQNIEIVCPLSYGDEKYRKEIIAYGTELFGEKFIPLTEYMEKEAYCEMAASCDIGIFNNNRQQGMGNINLMLQLGKKLFLKSSTSMWDSYTADGIILHDILEIKEINNVSDLLKQTEMERNTNMKKIQNRLDGDKAIQAWKQVFDDNEGGGNG